MHNFAYYRNFDECVKNLADRIAYLKSKDSLIDRILAGVERFAAVVDRKGHASLGSVKLWEEEIKPLSDEELAALHTLWKDNPYFRQVLGEIDFHNRMLKDGKNPLPDVLQNRLKCAFLSHFSDAFDVVKDVEPKEKS